MIPVPARDSDRGALITVRVVPRAGRTEAVGILDGAIRIRVKAPPVEGAANKELLAYISKILCVPKTSVTIESGLANREKTVLVRGWTAGAVVKRLLEGR
jgi:uncharacterized protein